MKKLVYITVRTPFGKGEEFILSEIETLIGLGVDLLVVPRNPPRRIFHQGVAELLPHTHRIPLFNATIAGSCIPFLIQEPRRFFETFGDLIHSSRNWKTAVKNLVILPKALYLARILSKEDVYHIHAHWAGTTATLAYVISRLTGISWSMTVHRGDIRQDNLLVAKAQSATFIRCISEHGANLLRSYIGNGFDHKLKVIHMGVDCHDAIGPVPPEWETFVIAMPANLLPVKGHKYLIEACSLLLTRSTRNFKCFFYGEGPLRRELVRQVTDAKLGAYIEMPGQIPHHDLMERYRKREVHAVVLPSINTDDGEHEGIPVSLMEAMAHAIPVVATATGGIPELLGDGSGILVDEKNREQLADAMLRLMRDPGYYRSLGERGQAKVMGSFEITKCCQDLVRLFGLG